jgi:hypothetical protein
MIRIWQFCGRLSPAFPECFPGAAKSDPSRQSGKVQAIRQRLAPSRLSPLPPPHCGADSNRFSESFEAALHRFAEKQAAR